MCKGCSGQSNRDRCLFLEGKRSRFGPFPESNSDKREVYFKLNGLKSVTDEGRFLRHLPPGHCIGLKYLGDSSFRRIKLLQSQRSDAIRGVSEVQGRETRVENGEVAEADLVH